MYIAQTPTHHFPLKETIDFSIFLILWPIVPFHCSTGNMHISFCLPNICNDTEPRTCTTVLCLPLFRVEIWKEDYDLFLLDNYVNISYYHNEFLTLLVREHVLSVACFIIQSRYIWILPVRGLCSKANSVYIRQNRDDFLKISLLYFLAVRLWMRMHKTQNKDGIHARTRSRLARRDFEKWTVIEMFKYC